MSKTNQKDNNVANNDDAVEVSQSDIVVNRLRHEALRTTKSSPHRNLELHHTRSFSEIRHLHPSTTDLSGSIPHPKPKVIDSLQLVKKPESVLEISELSAPDSEEDFEENIFEAQERGDEAMKIFLESNISVPLDGALTSSSGSLQSFDSDLASEHELIVATWESEGRDSVASSGTNIEKRFLTPSGQLLYREQQVDSMLDTKRLKLSPSNLERPMSPLAMQRSDDAREFGRTGITGNVGKIEKVTECSCGLSSKFKDMQRLVNEYEVQYYELVKRRKLQSDEMKALRKDNVNMHKEHNRLQLIIKESYKNDELAQQICTKVLEMKEKKIKESNMIVEKLKEEVRGKNEEIAVLRETIEKHETELGKYDEVFKEVCQESNAFLEALTKELRIEEREVISLNRDGNNNGIAQVLKKRRCSLHDDFINFTMHSVQPTTWTQTSSRTTDVSIKELQSHLDKDFHQMTSECKQALSQVQDIERNLGNIQQTTAGLETILLHENKMNEHPHLKVYNEKLGLERQLQEQDRKYNDVAQENGRLMEECIKWKNESERIAKEHSKIIHESKKLECELNDRINAFYEERTQAHVKVEGLKADMKRRLENSYREKTAMEIQLEKLRDKYLKTECPTLQEDQKKQGEENASQEYWVFGQQKQMHEKNDDGGRADQVSLTQTKMNGQQDVVDHLKHLTQLTDDLSNKVEKTNQQVNLLSKMTTPAKELHSLNGTVNKGNNNEIFSVGNTILWEIKGIYQEQFNTIQQNFIKQKLENQFLKEQLMMKERDEEVNKCYIASLKRANEIIQEDLRISKTKYHELKKELREIKDHVLIKNVEDQVSLYISENNIKEDSVIKQQDCFNPQKQSQSNKKTYFHKMQSQDDND